MATDYSNLAWEIPWAEEPGGLQSMGLQKSQRQLNTHTHTHTHHTNYLPCLAVIVEDGYYYHLCFTKEELKL